MDGRGSGKTGISVPNRDPDQGGSRMEEMVGKPQRIPRQWNKEKGQGGGRERAKFTRHEHYGEKYRNWFLVPTRSILILGDSNMSRLPRIQDDRVQMDCYSGAQLAHACHLLRNKTRVSPQVGQVILGFGLNNRTQQNPALLTSLVKRLIMVTKATFPAARVQMLIVNRDEGLSHGVKVNIAQLNKIICETGMTIPGLQKQLFATVDDKINWTEPKGDMGLLEEPAKFGRAAEPESTVKEGDG